MTDRCPGCGSGQAEHLTISVAHRHRAGCMVCGTSGPWVDDRHGAIAAWLLLCRRAAPGPVPTPDDVDDSARARENGIRAAMRGELVGLIMDVERGRRR